MAAPRTIQRFVAATSTKALQRLIGTVDVKGKGTAHALAGVDPVVLCDAATVMGKGKPAFGMHPHYGLIACTTVVQGGFTDGDNLNPPNDHINREGGIYLVSAGRGVCHQEASGLEGKHIAVQTIFKIPEDKKHLPPELIRVEPSDIPDLGLSGGTAKLLVGHLGDIASPAKVQALPRVVVLMVTANANSKMEIPFDADLEHGFAYVIAGKCKLGGGEEWCEAEKGLWLFGEGASLGVEAGEEGAKLFMIAGKPLNEPWVKTLGNNGFIITRDEAEGDAVMKVIHETGNDFSFQKLEGMTL